MNVLVLGADGFIGARLVRALLVRGHTVKRGARRAQRGDIAIDFMRDWRAEDWLPRLRDAVDEVEVVVNTVGVIAESPGTSFDGLHVRAPTAVATACARCAIRYVHLSALGAEARDGVSDYLVSKGRGEIAVIAALPSAVLVRPSLVFGPEGTSAGFFSMLASLPVLVLPATAGARVQPIHVEDLVNALVTLVESPAETGAHALVGPRALTWREWLQGLRRAMDLRPVRVLELPPALDPLVRAAGRLTGGNLVGEATLTMLRAGNTADATDTTRLLGHPPRPVTEFIAPELRRALRQAAQLAWLLPVARSALAATWAWSAVVSAGVYPFADSLALLEAAGLHGTAGWAALAAGIGVDAAFALLSVWVPAPGWRPWVWRLQIATVLLYTAIISAALPAFWLHPFGPLLKNLPLLILLWMLLQFDEPPSRQP